MGVTWNRTPFPLVDWESTPVRGVAVPLTGMSGDPPGCLARTLPVAGAQECVCGARGCARQWLSTLYMYLIKSSQ